MALVIQKTAMGVWGDFQIMKIYLAATAPGNEQCHENGFLPLPRRLLSYYFITTKMMETDIVFQNILETKKGREKQNDE